MTAKRAVFAAAETSRAEPGLHGPVTEDLLGSVVRRLRAVCDPEAIILFGSHAYGEPDAESDLDLLVILESDLPAPDRAVALGMALTPRTVAVDLVVRTPSEIEEALRRGESWVVEALRQGRVLYGSTSFSHRLAG